MWLGFPFHLSLLIPVLQCADLSLGEIPVVLCAFLGYYINFRASFGRRRSNMSPARFPVKQFYEKMLDGAVWTRVLEEHVRNTWDKVWCGGSSHAATLEMAGVTTVVYGQEMHPKPDIDCDIDMFL